MTKVGFLLYPFNKRIRMDADNCTGIRDMSTSSQSRLDKEFVRKRLVWIVEKMDESRTSRATLNAVNEFLMGMKR